MVGRILIDGEPASTDDLTHQALVAYGAYTSFGVVEGAARGLDRHLARLEAAAVELFGEAVPEAKMRGLMRRAIEDRSDGWLRVSLFSPEIGHRSPGWTGRPRVMTATFPTPAPLGAAMRVQSRAYLRELPHLKHVATLGLIAARRAARVAGFDDALFVHPDGRVLEGALWNIGFLQGDHVVWPAGPKLEGVAQALIADALPALGLTQETRPVWLDEIAAFDGAFLCNSATPACAITAIDGHDLLTDARVVARLADAWASARPQPI